MVGEWSASFDILPAARINEIMEVIAATGRAPYMDRQLSAERQDFIRDYVKAQMVSFEEAGYKNRAWFYWSAKMENAAFAEWDFLRGIQDGWFPNPVLPPHISSTSEYGTCYDLLFAISDNRTIIHEFPNPEDAVPSPHEATVDDDIVSTHGQSLMDPSMRKPHTNQHPPQPINHRHTQFGLPSFLLLTVMLAMAARFVFRCNQRRSKYTPIGDDSVCCHHPCGGHQNSLSPVKTEVSIPV